MKSQETKSYILAFLLGILTCIVGMRATERYIQRTININGALLEDIPVASSTREDAACIARVLYGIRDYELSEKAKAAVVEIVLNRLSDTDREFRNYNTIRAVCNQPEQWQGYNPGGPYLETDYELALAVMNNDTGSRVVPENCYFLLVKQGEIIARTEFNGGNEWTVK